MKILFADMDETLLSSDKTISKGNLEAIKAMTDKGHGFVLCTGRPLYSCLVLARQYGFVGRNFYIASFNGGQIVDTADMSEIYHEGITKEMTRSLFDAAKERGLNAQTYNNDCILVEPWSDIEYIEWYATRIRMPYKVVEDVVAALEADPLKCIVAHMSDHAALERFQAEIGPRYPLTNNIFSNPVLLEFGSKYASKGRAVEVLAQKLGVNISDTIAVGDEENDLSMIETAGIGVAMKNAVPKVLQAGDVITDNDNNHDAIAEIIEKYVM